MKKLKNRFIELEAIFGNRGEDYFIHNLRQLVLYYMTEDYFRVNELYKPAALSGLNYIIS